MNCTKIRRLKIPMWIVPSGKISKAFSCLIVAAALTCCGSKTAGCGAYPEEIQPLRFPIFNLVRKNVDSKTNSDVENIMRCLSRRYRSVSGQTLTFVVTKENKEGGTYSEFLVRGQSDKYLVVKRDKYGKISVFEFSSISGPAI